ncbi:MAG: (d)CMP kinase [Armatimonadetes bacterium]|nr:(d)CMP kinase [Armatimonadota bacterium]
MTPRRPVTVAIDGPAGSGKSTVSKQVARQLGYAYVDTGAMYRAVALLGMRAGLAQEDRAGFAAQAAQARMEFRVTEAGQRFLVNGEDCTEAVRDPAVGARSSPVSAIPEVRQHLTAAQQRLAAGGGVVMEGRDIGTVVCPAAEVKVFVTATPPERARRRYLELQAKGKDVTEAEVLAEITERDRRDSSREVAPLRMAEDAHELVTDGLSIEEVVGRIIDLVREAEAR